jgi:Cys-rich repeat protein
VSGRTAVAASAAVVMALPLVGLVWMLLRPMPPPETPAALRGSPMLNPEQRLRLTTYRRECSSGAECEPPLGCLFEVRYRQAYCTDSQCAADAQCPEGQVCRALATKDDGPRVRICVPLGERREGEGCDAAPKDQQRACAAGLVCGGRDDTWCARPCRLDAREAACPEGFFCTDTAPEPVCLPTCEGKRCPTGQQCVHFEGGASSCAQVYGANCQESSCPGDRKCQVLTSPPHPGKAWMGCIERCGKGLPACGPGNVCDVWRCLPDCDPREPDVCGEGYRCSQRWPDTPFACRPAG